MTPGISVVIPTYNEVENVSDLIAQIDLVLGRSSIPGEIIIVDDNSPDGTAQKAQAAKTLADLRVIVRTEPRDLSTAVVEGLRQARHDVAVVCDADLSHPPEKIPELARPVLEDRADMAIGSRYAAGGRVEGWAWYRKLFSRAAKALARPLVNVRDPLSGFFAVRKSTAGIAPLRPEGYKIGLELMVRLNLKKVVEVPILFQDRRLGVSKLGSRMALAYFRQLRRLMTFQLRLPGNSVAGWILGAMLGVGAILHLITASSFGLIPEEAYHWDYARHPDWSYFDHPPMVGWMIWLGTFLLGDHPVAVRLPAILASCVTGLLIYRLTSLVSREGRAEQNGLTAALLYSAIPFFWGLGFISMPDTFLVLFWTAALYSLSKVIAQDRGAWWYGAGVFFGLAMLSKYTAVFLAAGVGLFLLISGKHRAWLLRKEPYLAALIALALFSPVLLWNLQHDWASFQFQTTRRFDEFKPISGVRFAEFLGTQALTFWPPVFFFMLYVVGRRLRSLALGEEGTGSLLFWSFFPIFLGFAWVGLRTEVHISWPAPAYLGLIPVAAATIGRPRIERERWRKWGLALLFFPLILYLLAAVYLPIFGVPPIANAEVLVIPEELAKRVAKAEAPLARGSYFIFADGKYRMASLLAFYLKAPERVYSQNVIGEIGLSFNYWGDLKSLVGKDAIFVAENTSAYTSGALQAHFDRVSQPEPIDVRKGNIPLATFFLVRCYGYKGPSVSP